MRQQNIGYITVDFYDEDKIKIADWSKSIKEEHLYFASINGKVEGGNVVDDLHLTLFYGFDEEKIDENKVIDFIKNINVDSVEIKGVNFFSLPGQEYKVLFLSIKDDFGYIKNIHEEFKKFPHFPEYQKLEFSPHLTVAFVKKELDISEVIYSGPKVLRVKKITHHIKSKV